MCACAQYLAILRCCNETHTHHVSFGAYSAYTVITHMLVRVYQINNPEATQQSESNKMPNKPCFT